MERRSSIEDFTHIKNGFTCIDFLGFRNAKLGIQSPTQPDGPSVRMNLTIDDVAKINQRIGEITAQNAKNQSQSIELAGHQYCN